jgi:hypothetical protein
MGKGPVESKCNKIHLFQVASKIVSMQSKGDLAVNQATSMSVGRECALQFLKCALFPIFFN